MTRSPANFQHITLTELITMSKYSLRPLKFVLAITVCALVAACSDSSPTAPGLPKFVPGVLSLRIEGVREGDRALLIRISGLAATTSLQVTQSGLALHARSKDGGVSAAIFGGVMAGELGTISVSNIAAPGVVVTLVEVADSQGVLRSESEIASYQLTVAPR